MFGALVPTDFGGLDLTIPDVTEVVRTLSTYDASVGWTYAITSGAPLAGRMLSRSAFEDIFRDSHPLMSGSLNPTTGKAVPVEGGFRFSGTAMFASGCRHASWLMVGAWVQRDGEPSFTDRGPEFVAGVMPMDRVRINDTWSVTGHAGDGKQRLHDRRRLRLRRLRLSRGSTPLPASRPGRSGGSLCSSSSAPVSPRPPSAAARGAQQRFIELATAKRPVGAITTLAERAYGQMAAGEAEGLILAAEDTLAAAAAEAWRRGERGEPFDRATRVAFRMRLVTAVRLAGRAIDLLHDAAGMSAIAVPSPLERAWRDVHAASQHILLGVGRIEVAGRALLGLDPGFVI